MPLIPLKELGKYVKFASMSFETFGKYQLASLNEDIFVELTELEWIETQEKFEKWKVYEEKLYKTVMLNNKGIELEKSGQFDEAISVYEENIKFGLPATHSYNRLIVLYKKRKMKNDEYRVCQLYIDVFTSENEKRFITAIKEYDIYKTEIEIARETNSEFRGFVAKFNREMVIYCPYPVHKYIIRLSKIKKQMTN